MEEETKKPKISTNTFRIIVLFAITALICLIGIPAYMEHNKAKEGPTQEQYDSLKVEKDLLEIIADSLDVQNDTLKKKPSCLN